MRSSALEDRLARLEDEKAILHLKYQYAAYCDTGYDLDGFRSIFTPNGRWAANGFGTFTGHDEICRFFEELSATVVQVLHYVTSPRITVADDGRTATGDFYLLCLSRSRDRGNLSVVDSVATMGTYEDRFVKLADRWLIEEMKVNVGHVAKIPPFKRS
jgi:hypothetical protein